jgi:hypothetical protein
MWTTFRRLMIEEICWIGKDIGDFVKVDFFDKNRFYRFAPPSWILNFQTLRFLIDTSRTNKTHIRFLKFVDFWPFGSENKIFSFLGAILDFAAILDYSSKI